MFCSDALRRARICTRLCVLRLFPWLFSYSFISKCSFESFLGYADWDTLFIIWTFLTQLTGIDVTAFVRNWRIIPFFLWTYHTTSKPTPIHLGHHHPIPNRTRWVFQWVKWQRVFLVTDSCVLNRPLGHSLRSFAHTAHSAHSLRSAPLRYARFARSLHSWARSLTILEYVFTLWTRSTRTNVFFIFTRSTPWFYVWKKNMFSYIQIKILSPISFRWVT